MNPLWNLYPIKYILWLFIDTLIINNNLIGPSLVNITQIWVVIRHQYGFSAVVPHMTFPSPRNGWWWHEMLTVFSGYKLSILSCLVETLNLMTVLYIIYSWTVTSKTKCWWHRKKKRNGVTKIIWLTCCRFYILIIDLNITFIYNSIAEKTPKACF